ncbi:MAG: replication initiation protein [Candidatus Sedimenticola sp. (ex Thyasira tokunagai)]
MSRTDVRKIAKSNLLVESSYRLKVNEQRLLLTAIAKLRPKMPLPKAGVKISVSEFAECFSHVMDPHYAYEALREAIGGLFDRSITNIDGKKRESVHWLSKSTTYEDAYVILHFNEHVAPYLSDLHGHYTDFTMKQISGLKSFYTIRLLELLARFDDTGLFTVSLEKFRGQMGVAEGQYKKWHDFRKRVIDPAVAELRDQGQWDIEYVVKKRGRSVHGLEFHFQPVDQMPLNLED